MRLINTKTLQLEEFLGKVPKYAILSHRWRTGKDGEASLRTFKRFLKSKEALSYQASSGSSTSSTTSSGSSNEDQAISQLPTEPQSGGVLVNGQRGALSVSPGIQKVLEFCQQARTQGYAWAWLDTVCINKNATAELSEAINSMYRWYQNSGICFVYLHDVNNGDEFADSDWFRRGWTLQELIGPRDVAFHGSDWEFLGTKEELKSIISDITGIPEGVLSRPKRISKYCAAQKMSWAANRMTTREEDLAYCLLGLFDVNMELLYGEGAIKAFWRLQIKILEEAYDESLFTWELADDDTPAKGKLYIMDPKLGTTELVDICSLTGVLATKPQQFSQAGHIELARDYAPETPCKNSSWGVELTREVRELKNVSIRPSGVDEWDLFAASVIMIPLSCRVFGTASCCQITVAEDLSSMPVRRWCRVIRSDRWMADRVENRVGALEDQEYESTPRHLFIRKSWPESSRSLSRSRSVKGMMWSTF